MASTAVTAEVTHLLNFAEITMLAEAVPAPVNPPFYWGFTLRHQDRVERPDECPDGFSGRLARVGGGILRTKMDDASVRFDLSDIILAVGGPRLAPPAIDLSDIEYGPPSA